MTLCFQTGDLPPQVEVGGKPYDLYYVGGLGDMQLHGYSFLSSAVYSSSSRTHTFNTATDMIEVLVIGGGGGGGYLPPGEWTSSRQYYSSGAGGNGATVLAWIDNVKERIGSSVLITIGSSSAMTTSSSSSPPQYIDGANGNVTSFGSFITCTGGGGAKVKTNPHTGGFPSREWLGGAGGVGTVNIETMAQLILNGQGGGMGQTRLGGTLLGRPSRSFQAAALKQTSLSTSTALQKTGGGGSGYVTPGIVTVSYHYGAQGGAGMVLIKEYKKEG
ncbi:hypothetical protein MWH03_00095 [Klebsiella pneumoniae]|nr:hypothetical protein [Klebsiella pneumoniae]